MISNQYTRQRNIEDFRGISSAILPERNLDRISHHFRRLADELTALLRKLNEVSELQDSEPMANVISSFRTDLEVIPYLQFSFR